jgi:hypothetical protein
MGKPWHLIGNTRIGKFYEQRIYKQVVAFLDKSHASVLCLQEAVDYIPMGLEDRLRDLGFVWISDHTTNKNDLNIIASKYPVVASGEVALKDLAAIPDQHAILHPGHSMCSWVDCLINGIQVRIYNIQFRIRGLGIAERVNLLKQIFEHTTDVECPTIICGDLNTTIPHYGLARRIVRLLHHEPESSMYVNGSHIITDERYAIQPVVSQAGFVDVLDIHSTTWALPYTSWELFKLKLDWFFIRGLTAGPYTLGPYITDHRPISVELLV